MYLLTVDCPHDLLQVPPDGGEADCPVARGGGDHHRAVTRAQVTCSGYYKFYPTKLCLVAKHYSSAVLFVNKQKEEVMTELGAPATLSSSPGLRGRDERHP